MRCLTGQVSPSTEVVLELLLLEHIYCNREHTAETSA